MKSLYNSQESNQKVFIGVKYLVGACYVVICINLLSTLVGILEFPNLVKLPKFTSNGRKNSKDIFIHFVRDRHTLKTANQYWSPFQVEHIKGYFLVTCFAIDHPESVFGWCRNKGRASSVSAIHVGQCALLSTS